MSLTNTNELDEKVTELRNLLIKEDNYAYATGYMESLFTRIIKAYVPANKHAFVIDLIQSHIDTASERIS